MMSDASPFKWRHFEAEIILLCEHWYLRYALSYRDLEEMMLERVRHVSGEREYFGEGCWKASLPLTYPCQWAETLKEEGDDSMSGSAPKEARDLLLCESTASLRRSE